MTSYDTNRSRTLIPTFFWTPSDEAFDWAAESIVPLRSRFSIRSAADAS